MEGEGVRKQDVRKCNIPNSLRGRGWRSGRMGVRMKG